MKEKKPYVEPDLNRHEQVQEITAGLATIVSSRVTNDK